MYYPNAWPWQQFMDKNRKCIIRMFSPGNNLWIKTENVLSECFALETILGSNINPGEALGHKFGLGSINYLPNAWPLQEPYKTHTKMLNHLGNFPMGVIASIRAKHWGINLGWVP